MEGSVDPARAQQVRRALHAPARGGDAHVSEDDALGQPARGSARALATGEYESEAPSATTKKENTHCEARAETQPAEQPAELKPNTTPRPERVRPAEKRRHEPRVTSV